MFSLVMGSDEGCTVEPMIGTYYFSKGASVTVKANVKEGYKWYNWAGRKNGEVFASLSNPLTIVMDANFSLVAYTQRISAPPTPTPEGLGILLILGILLLAASRRK